MGQWWENITSFIGNLYNSYGSSLAMLVLSVFGLLVVFTFALVISNVITTKKNSNVLNKKMIVASALILILMPLTILFGVYFMEDRKYYFISFLLIFYAMIPFFMIFENRRPQAREIIIIAVLTAIAVAGRAAFIMLPYFDPIIAVVIISGVCFGAESGFLVGAMTAVVSNFFFGQGPWTPWQMFTFGLIGFMAGVFFKRGILKKKRLSLCIFGFICALFIFGGIMDICALLMFTPNITFPSLIAMYITGIPVNLVRGLAAIFFLYFISQPLIEKLERIKLKYGIIES